MNFETKSSDNLVSNLADDWMKIARKYFLDDTKFKLMRKKGVYPYDYIDSPERMDEVRQRYAKANNLYIWSDTLSGKSPMEVMAQLKLRILNVSFPSTPFANTFITFTTRRLPG